MTSLHQNASASLSEREKAMRALGRCSCPFEILVTTGQCKATGFGILFLTEQAALEQVFGPDVQAGRVVESTFAGDCDG